MIMTSSPSVDLKKREELWYINQLDLLPLFQNFQRDFEDVTSLPLTLVTPDGERTGRESIKNLSPFCGLLAMSEKCKGCALFRESFVHDDHASVVTRTCFAGFCESRVAIKSGERTLGYILTGEVALSKLTQANYLKVARQLTEWDVVVDAEKLRAAFFSTRVIDSSWYDSVLGLLEIFAGHLALIAGQLALRDDHSEAAAITRARQYIKEHLAEPLELKQVAESAHLSSCYFCKRFKESTGFTFTGYVARTRVEAAKNLLIRPQARVSEVAFEVGFQSLTHFNRVFKQIEGQSPTKYREGLPKVARSHQERRGRRA
jgi:AraC-like DNA-binding protein/ligand-binding sensor protein